MAKSAQISIVWSPYQKCGQTAQTQTHTHRRTYTHTYTQTQSQCVCYAAAAAVNVASSVGRSVVVVVAEPTSFGGFRTQSKQAVGRQAGRQTGRQTNKKASETGRLSRFALLLPLPLLLLLFRISSHLCAPPLSSFASCLSNQTTKLLSVLVGTNYIYIYTLYLTLI